MKIFYLLITLIVTNIFLYNCNSRNVPDEIVLFDFESDSELDQVHWKCHTLMSVCDQNVTHGKGSLKLELFPSDYPGFSSFYKNP